MKKKAASRAMRKAASIDDYLSGVTDPVRVKTLQAVRKAIHKLEPSVVECISYAIPAFRWQGSVIAGFAATAKGCSYFPFSGQTLKTLASQLESYSQTKSALHFDAKKPLPASVLGKLILARKAEVQARPVSKRTRRQGA
ncbi:MAG TPA: DUF1801 domain-containing protein [Polyangiaceae bacterium]|jgi:uncharacterized protein YdhG (YjbR/CyaY superfamily)|nr:DUF1801 domain-containing protein [Polyangiaceae bacterium]